MATKILILFCALLSLTLIVQPWPARPTRIEMEAIDLSLFPEKRRIMARKKLDKFQENPLLQLTETEHLPWEHYPHGDTKSNGYLYYYHSHRENEHGHFHIFAGEPSHFFHIIAISIDQEGKPKMLFTTNEWVTGESKVTKEELFAALEKFHLEENDPLNEYLNALVHYYSPHIAHLLSLKKGRRTSQEILHFISLELCSQPG